MDPFSIIVGTTSLIDVCVRLVTFLKDFHEAAAKVGAEISALQHEFEALIAVNESIHTLFEEELEKATLKQEETKGSPGVPPDESEDADPVQNIWREIGRNLQECVAVVKKLEEHVREIVGTETEAKTSPKFVQKIEGYKKSRRKESGESKLRRLRIQLTTFQGALQMLMTAITTSYTRGIQSTANKTNRSIDELSGNVLSLQNQIESLKPLIQSPDVFNLRASVQSAAAIASSVSPNKHFDIPQSVSSIFTGRDSMLKELKNALIAPRSPGQVQTQRRFIIFGLGGSGKTQFCCKFAQENRMNFWAIFWIDGSSEAQATQTFSKIAKIGGVEPNKAAAKNWLSNLEYSWLLIIDNADDPHSHIEGLFPEGERGHILVTTRNPALQLHGTVGARSFHFEELKDNEANNLLLKAANKPSPWDLRTQELASAITKTLGFLPLALIHAGRAIMNGFCTLGNYIDSYDMNWQRVRRSRGHSNLHEDEENMYLNIYSSYEVIYLGLEGKDTQAAKDAIELLKTFSFFHRENIRVDFLTRAALNPAAEREEEERQKQNEKQNRSKASQTAKTWSQTFDELKLAFLMFLLKDRSPAVLPKVLRDTEELGFFDDHRLRMALKELTQMSLITYNYSTDSYSMHPLVHTWVRERPKMSTPEQAIWCQAAATTLAQSILLPPLGSSEADEDLRRDLLPHVEHVQRCQKAVAEQIDEKRKQRKRPWPALGPRFGRPEALRLAKFSLVYAQCGRWDIASQLQVRVKDFVCAMLGPEHPRAMDIMLALSGTYWQLGQGNEAADLQVKVLAISKKSLGENDPKTFRVMDTLGVSRWQQGKFSNALALHTRAIEGLTLTLGPSHQDTLKATAHLGRVLDKYFRFDEARALHLTAVAGLKKTLGPTHLETLIAMDNLAMTYLSLGGDHLLPAQDLLLTVLAIRTKKLGKEHPYTLWAACNLARVETALGDLEQAECRIRAGLAIAERNLGPDHIGTLYGQVYLAEVLVARERYADAEAILLWVIERHQFMASASNSLHPDRISAMWHLLQCYRVQGRVEDALRVCAEVGEGLEVLGAGDHPLARQLEEVRAELKGVEVGVRRRGAVEVRSEGGGVPG